MKTLFKVAALAVVAGFAASAISVSAASTNLVQHISFQLTLQTQGPSKTNRPGPNEITRTVVKTPITTKDVIAWLGAALNTNTFTNTFSTRARLVRVKHVDANTNYTTVEIRDGTNAPVDVTAFFAGTGISQRVQHSTYHTLTGLTEGKDYGVLHLELSNTPPYSLVPHFSVNGYETTSFVTIQSGKTRVSAEELDADTLAGTGSITNGVTGVIEGAASISGTFTEVK